MTENAPAVEAASTTIAPAIPTIVNAPAEDKKVESAPAAKAALPKRRPLSNLFSFKPRKASQPAPESEKVNEKAPEVVQPSEPVQPATVEIGSPATVEKLHPIPAIVTGEMADAGDKPVPVDAVTASPVKDRKESHTNLFDRLKRTLSSEKKSPLKKDEPTADEATKAAESEVAGKIEETADKPDAPIEVPAAPTATAGPKDAIEATEPKSAKVSRRLSARIFGGLTPKKAAKTTTDDKKVESAATKDEAATAKDEAPAPPAEAAAVAPEPPAKIPEPVAADAPVAEPPHVNPAVVSTNEVKAEPSVSIAA